MGLGNIAKKAKDALSSDKGEQVSDQVLDRGAGLANRATGGKYADKVERGRDAVDQRVGNEGLRGGTTGATDTTATDADTGAPGAEAGATGRHRADTAPDEAGSASPGDRKHRA